MAKEDIFENDLFTLTDEEGNESQFELLGTIEMDDKTYVALIPNEGEQDEYVILRLDYDEDDGELFVTIDDDDEFDRVADEFEDAFMGEFDFDANGFSVDDEIDEDDDDEDYNILSDIEDKANDLLDF